MSDSHPPADPDEHGTSTNRRTTLTRRAALGLAGVSSLSLLSGQAAAQNRPWNRDVDAQGHMLCNLGELTMADNLTGIRDFEGENLRVNEEGILDAGSTLTVHHIDEYGADPSGKEPSDEAFDAAVEAAEDGDWIAFTNGTYYLAERHHIYKELIIYGAGGTIESDVHPETGYFDDEVDGTQNQSVYTIISFYGEQGNSVLLTKPVTEGSDQLLVEDTGPFEVGGGVLINNATEDTSDPYYPTVSTIREIDDGVLYLDIPSRYDYDDAADAHNVYPLDLLDNCGFVECHFRNRHEFYWDDDLRKVMGGFRDPMYHRHCRRPLVIDCTVSGYDTKAWTCVDVLEALIVNFRAERPMNVNGQHAETIYITGSTNVNIYNPVIREARRPIDIAGGLRAIGDDGGRGGCKDVNVYNPDITGVTLTGLSFHNSADTHVPGNLNVYGGRIECRPNDPTIDDHGGEADRRWELHRGRGGQDTNENGRLHVKGTKIVGRENCLSLYGTDALIEGCELTTVPADAGIEQTLEEGDNAALSISGENVTIRDTVIYENPNGSAHSQAVLIEGGRNIDIDVTVRGDFGENPVTIDGGEQIRLHAQLSDANDESSRISLGGEIDGLSLSGTGNHAGYGVEFRDDIDARNVTINDFTHYGMRPTVHVEEGASIENLRLSGITAGGENNHFEFGDTFVDGLWIKDCIVDELRGFDDGQENDEHTFITDNRTDWTG